MFRFAKKPSAKPSKGDLKKVESMRQYGVATYHNTGPRKGMTESIVFDKSHGGYNGGTYIYYYVECRNSVGKAETAVDYVVVKRWYLRNLNMFLYKKGQDIMNMSIDSLPKSI